MITVEWNDSNRTTMNADNADLQPLAAGPVLIGCVDAVNGTAAQEVPEFVITRAELVELAKYWEETFLSRAFFVFKTRQIGSTDLRVCPFAERRVARIIELLGDKAVEAVQEVEDEFARSVGVVVSKKFFKYLGPKHLHQNKLRRGHLIPESGVITNVARLRRPC